MAHQVTSVPSEAVTAKSKTGGLLPTWRDACDLICTCNIFKLKQTYSLVCPCVSRLHRQSDCYLTWIQAFGVFCWGLLWLNYKRSWRWGEWYLAMADNMLVEETHGSTEDLHQKNTSLQWVRDQMGSSSSLSESFVSVRQENKRNRKLTRQPALLHAKRKGRLGGKKLNNNTHHLDARGSHWELWIWIPCRPPYHHPHHQRDALKKTSSLKRLVNKKKYKFFRRRQVQSLQVDRLSNAQCLCCTEVMHTVRIYCSTGTWYIQGLTDIAPPHTYSMGGNGGVAKT